MAQVVESLLLLWKTWLEFLALSFSPGPALAKALGIWRVNQWMGACYLYVYLSAFQIHEFLKEPEASKVEYLKAVVSLK